MSKYRRVRFLRRRSSSRYCCYENHAAGSKPISKLLRSQL